MSIARNPCDRKLQRALMQFFKPENDFLVRDVPAQAGRADRIGGCDGRIPAHPPKTGYRSGRSTRKRRPEKRNGKPGPGA